MADLFYEMGALLVSNMFTLWVLDNEEWFEEAIAEELSSLFDEAAEITGPWKITDANDNVLLAGE